MFPIQEITADMRTEIDLKRDKTQDEFGYKAEKMVETGKTSSIWKKKKEREREKDH